MSQRQALHSWAQSMIRHMPQLSKPQAYTLAAFSLGIALARRCTLSAVAEALPALGKPDTVERRLQRCLANTHLTWQHGMQAWARWVLSRLSDTERLVLLIDETSLKDKLRVMALSLAYRGRAIPLAWWCYPPKQWPMKQVDLITTLFDRVAPALPQRCRVLVEADRGIGTSPDLLRAIERRGWCFLVRVQGQVRLRLEDGRGDGTSPVVPFTALVPHPGQRYSGQVEAFQGAGWISCWALGQWDARHSEPWLLLTNDPQVRASSYGIRMWEELAFRDFKSTGWQWQQSHVWEAEHANRLWLVMALAYGWMLSLGTQVVRTPALRRELTRGKGKRHSVFQLGLRLLRRWLALGRHLSCELWLVPHAPLCPKTVV